MRLGMTNDRCMPAANIDPWFLAQIEADDRHGSAHPRQHGLPKDAEEPALLKAMGFSDAAAGALRQART
jgi:hypothetical protein